MILRVIKSSSITTSLFTNERWTFQGTLKNIEPHHRKPILDRQEFFSLDMLLHDLAKTLLTSINFTLFKKKGRMGYYSNNLNAFNLA